MTLSFIESVRIENNEKCNMKYRSFDDYYICTDDGERICRARYNKMKRCYVTYDGDIYDDGLRLLDKFIRPTPSSKKYLHVMLNGKIECVHLLVAFCYAEGYDKGLIVDHIIEGKNEDGTPTRNDAGNLQYISRQQNTSKAIGKKVSMRINGQSVVFDTKRLAIESACQSLGYEKGTPRYSAMRAILDGMLSERDMKKCLEYLNSRFDGEDFKPSSLMISASLMMPRTI